MEDILRGEFSRVQRSAYACGRRVNDTAPVYTTRPCVGGYPLRNAIREYPRLDATWRIAADNKTTVRQ